MIRITMDDLVALLKCRHGSGYKLSTKQVQNMEGLVEHQEHWDYAGIPDMRFYMMHMLSQLAHECDHFKAMEEYASGAAYEGRQDLGNVNPGDGRRYKGRGYIMITGRYNYRTVGTRIGVNLEAHPKKASEHENAVKIAADYWHSRNINQWAKGDNESNIRSVTKSINGGYNGYDDRKAYFMCAGTIWTAEPTDPPPVEAPPSPPTMPQFILDKFAATNASEIRHQEAEYQMVYLNPYVKP